MKKLLLASISLLLFSISILIFQVSCQKNATARTNDTITPIGKIVYVGNASSNDIYVVNFDGTDNHKISVTFPSNLSFANEDVSVSPDGSKIFFCLEDSGDSKQYIYSCTINGANLTRVSTIGIGDISGICAF